MIVAEDVAPDDNVLDDDYHGTNVAAIVASVAPDTRLIVYDIFDGAQALDRDIFKALNWVIRDHARYSIVAINMSFNFVARGYAQTMRRRFSVLCDPVPAVAPTANYSRSVERKPSAHEQH